MDLDSAARTCPTADHDHVFAEQLALFGFPPPGHPYWTEATLAGTAQRYPGLNMTPWQQALCGEA